MKTSIQFVLGDITKQSNVKAIVNAANSSLLGGGGVDGAIHRGAGPQLLEECRGLHGCHTGEAKLTKGYLLPCDYVIHTVGPIWYGGCNHEAEMLARCYHSVLTLAQKHAIRTLAFPSISTGVYHFPLDLAAKIAITTTCAFVQEHQEAFDKITWVLFDQRTYDAYTNVYKNY